jgi:hypothetical protein
MGFFRKLLQVAAPIVGGILGGPAGAAIGGGVSGLLGGQDKAHEQAQVGAQAAQTTQGGANTVRDINQPYTAAGAAANTQQANLLGIGSDPAAAGAGYQNYLNSVGYQGQMRAGQQAITSSAAARGLLGSGSTAKALQSYGTQLNAQNFNNYLGQLSGVANRGLSATGQVGSAVMQGAGDAAHYQYGSGQQAAESNASGWDQLIGGLGSAYDAWSAGRKKKSAAYGQNAWGATG